MKLIYIGAGFVGACSAAMAASSGHNVLVFDIDNVKIKALSSGDRDIIESCLFEEGLGDLIVRNQERINFTADYNQSEKFFDECDAVFMCLPTPEIGETGESDLSYYFLAAEQLANSLIKRNSGQQEKYIVVVNKSTVPIDMVDRTREILTQKGVKNFGVVSNPEFLVEGKAVSGSLKPDRIVIGAESEQDFAIIRRIYQRFYNSPNVQYIEASPREAAAGKLLANFYLLHKLVACFDVAGRVCEAFPGLKFENIRKILTTDKRLGEWGFYNSLYAGGSCLIKDVRSLTHQLNNLKVDTTLLQGVYSANHRQLNIFLDRAEKEAGISWVGKKVALLGTAFKRDTNDTRNSASVEIANFLLAKNVGEISAHDPAALENFMQIFKDDNKVKSCDSANDAILGADVIIIATDWPQFRGIADVLLDNYKGRPLIMDGRRMWQYRYGDLQKAGFDIISVGGAFIKHL